MWYPPMIRFLPMYVDVSVVVSAAPVRRTKARAKASVASSEISTTKGVSFRGFVTSPLRISEKSPTFPWDSPVSMAPPHAVHGLEGYSEKLHLIALRSASASTSRSYCWVPFPGYGRTEASGPRDGPRRHLLQGEGSEVDGSMVHSSSGPGHRELDGPLLLAWRDGGQGPRAHGLVHLPRRHEVLRRRWRVVHGQLPGEGLGGRARVCPAGRGFDRTGAAGLRARSVRLGQGPGRKSDRAVGASEDIPGSGDRDDDGVRTYHGMRLPSR